MLVVEKLNCLYSHIFLQSLHVQYANTTILLQDAEQHFYAKYELLEVLGVGSTSTCHRCIHKELKEDFACKIIDKRQLEERFQGLMAQFQTEIQALRSLQHPNIIRLYDVYISPNHIFIVMELMEGGELFDYVVQKGTLTEEEASRIVRKVTSALVYMHSKNIIHRDMKPENLLLKHQPSPRMGGDLDLEVKIIDFGLSKVRSRCLHFTLVVRVFSIVRTNERTYPVLYNFFQCMEESVARSFLGTRGYLAPEMLQRREYSRAVDTWALGVIVFVLLCGCLPFDDDSQTVPSDDLVRLRFVLRFPRWAKTLSASAKDLLNHLLDVNPHTRYTAEQALKHPWVTGEQAPKENLLQSPGRIKTTPKRTERGREYDMIPPKVTPTTTLLAPKRNVVRKTSF